MTCSERLVFQELAGSIALLSHDPDTLRSMRLVSNRTRRNVDEVCGDLIYYARRYPNSVALLLNEQSRTFWSGVDKNGSYMSSLPMTKSRFNDHMQSQSFLLYEAIQRGEWIDVPLQAWRVVLCYVTREQAIRYLAMGCYSRGALLVLAPHNSGTLLDHVGAIVHQSDCPNYYEPCDGGRRVRRTDCVICKNTTPPRYLNAEEQSHILLNPYRDSYTTREEYATFIIEHWLPKYRLGLEWKHDHVSLDYLVDLLPLRDQLATILALQIPLLLSIDRLDLSPSVATWEIVEVMRALPCNTRALPLYRVDLHLKKHRRAIEKCVESGKRRLTLHNEARVSYLGDLCKMHDEIRSRWKALKKRT